VLAVLPCRLGDGPRENIIFRELLGRDFITSAYGLQAWARALPLNERDVTEQGGDTRLDVISLNVRNQPLHAVLLERPTSTAASFFEHLAQEWQACEGLPMDSLLDRTIIALLALLKLLACVHGRARFFGGDTLEHLHLSESPLKDGHFKSAVATIQRSDGTPCAIMLGRATYMHFPNYTSFHRPECKQECKQEKSVGLPVARNRRQRWGGGGGVRFSERAVSKSAPYPCSEIQARALLSDLPEQPTPTISNDGGTLSCCGGYLCAEPAQRDDLRRAAQVIMNVLVGQSKGPTGGGGDVDAAASCFSFSFAAATNLARAASPVSPPPGPDAALRRRRSGSSSFFAAASSFRLRRRDGKAPPPLTGLGEAAAERKERLLWLLRWWWWWPSQRR
jgi:hypothetical protein